MHGTLRTLNDDQIVLTFNFFRNCFRIRSQVTFIFNSNRNFPFNVNFLFHKKQPTEKPPPPKKEFEKDEGMKPEDVRNDNIYSFSFFFCSDRRFQ